MTGLVYQAINAVTAELASSGIAKSQHNEQGNYSYRGIDDVIKTLAPLLAMHKLCVLPRVLEREAVATKALGHRVILRVALDLVSSVDGSTHTIESFGEAIDDSDKGTAKAMSAAYKAAMLQAFCIPVPHEDSDTSSAKLIRKGAQSYLSAEPPEGWESWSAEVVHIAESCESGDAIDRLLGGRRPQLSALQRGRPELYAKVGEAIAARLAEMQRPTGAAPRPSSAARQGDKQRNASRAPAEAA